MSNNILFFPTDKRSFKKFITLFCFGLHWVFIAVLSGFLYLWECAFPCYGAQALGKWASGSYGLWDLEHKLSDCGVRGPVGCTCEISRTRDWIMSSILTGGLIYCTTKKVQKNLVLYLNVITLTHSSSWEDCSKSERDTVTRALALLKVATCTHYIFKMDHQQGSIV